jgi:hypothetical protein
MGMVNRAMAVEKEVTLRVERLMARRRRAYHQSHLNVLSQNNQERIENVHQDGQTKHEIIHTEEQYPGMKHTEESSPSQKVMMKCHNYRRHGHKRA